MFDTLTEEINPDCNKSTRLATNVMAATEKWMLVALRNWALSAFHRDHLTGGLPKNMGPDALQKQRHHAR